MGLYINKGIALFLCVEILIYIVISNIRKTKRYVKLLINKKQVLVPYHKDFVKIDSNKKEVIVKLL